jgi:hypothetical protein
MQTTGDVASTPTLTRPAPPRAATAFRWLALSKSIAAGVVAGLLVVVLTETFNILIGDNFHEVAPGSIYRCAQLSGPRLTYYLKHKQIRTVINLRGCCEPSPWYLDECRACAGHNVSLEDLGFSAGRLPAVDTIRELVHVLEHCEYPILVHCHRGIDRTGMTVAMALLLRTDCSLEDALYQLGPRYGHLPLGPTGNIDRFFDLYQEYLAAKGMAHSRQTFRHWVLHEYCPGECHCRIEVLRPQGQPAVVPVGRPFAVSVRCHNTSVKPWRLRPATDAGIHAVWQLFDEQGAELHMGRSGLFHAEVQPGDSIDLTLSLPPIRQPGRYQLRIDMKDEQHAFFFQLGEDPLLWDLVAE